jgi:purine-nucleoside/S-methyl-5'-thioadenosine phosphorylase / adenosine deaminase
VLTYRVGAVDVRFTDRGDGDMGHAGAYVHEVAPDVEARRRAVLDAPWTWLRQVHGPDIVRVGHPGEGAGSRADAAVTTEFGCALAVLAADCAPIVLVAEDGVAVAHAGWKGLLAGVIEAAAGALRAEGADDIHALLGPCIRPECYEFGAGDLDAVSARLGNAVRSSTGDGRPALDLPAAVAVALQRAGVGSFDDVGECTACSPAKYYSHRARGDTGRQAAVVWRLPA